MLPWLSKLHPYQITVGGKDATAIIENSKVIISPATPLVNSIDYQVIMPVNVIEDLAGNMYDSSVSFAFRTIDPVVPPTGTIAIVETNPAEGQTNVSIRSNLTITLDQNFTNANVNLITISDRRGNPLSYSLSGYGSNVVTISFDNTLKRLETYTVVIEASAISNASATNNYKTFTFTTGK